MSTIDIPELRWCKEGGIVFRQAEDGTWVTLVGVRDADEDEVADAVRLLSVEEHCRRTDQLMLSVAELDWKARRRQYRSMVVLAAFLVTVTAALGRWFR